MNHAKQTPKDFGGWWVEVGGGGVVVGWKWGDWGEVEVGERQLWRGNIIYIPFTYANVPTDVINNYAPHTPSSIGDRWRKMEREERWRDEKFHQCMNFLRKLNKIIIARPTRYVLRLLLRLKLAWVGGVHGANDEIEFRRFLAEYLYVFRPSQGKIILFRLFFFLPPRPTRSSGSRYASNRRPRRGQLPWPEVENIVTMLYNYRIEFISGQKKKQKQNILHRTSLRSVMSNDYNPTIDNYLRILYLCM